MWRRVWSLFLKEFLSAFRDKRARIVLIIPPLVQLFIFAFAATLDVKNVPIGIVNLDGGERAFELIQRFHGSPTFSHISYLDRVEQIAPFLDNQKGVMVLFIDQQFSRNLDAKKIASVSLILDGRKSNTAQIIAGYASTIIEQYNKEISPRLKITSGEPTELIPLNWFNPNLLYYWYTVPSLCAILTMVVGIMVTALSIAREREMGTFDQLLVSPLRPIEILLGKSIPAIFIAIGEGSLIVLAAIFVFKVPFEGSILLLYLSLLVFVSAIVGVGLFISSLCSTQQQAILGSFVFISPSILLSGFATPIENMPGWLQPLTYAVPLRYMLIIVRGLFLKDMPAHIVLMDIWPMAVIAVCTLSCATWCFRRVSSQ